MLAEPREAPIKQSTFRLNSAWAGWIDLTTVYQGSADPVHSYGIYSVQGDALVYNVAAPGRGRPTRLESRPEDGCTLVVLRRVRDGDESASRALVVEGVDLAGLAKKQGSQ
jgi:hypothetical protein